MFHGKKIVVVMPAYNAAKTIEQTYREIPLDLVDEVVVTDTIPLNAEAQACKQIRQLSTAELLAETMRRISDDESVSSLYVD